MKKRSKFAMVKIGVTFTGNDLKQDNYIQWLKQNDDIEIIQLSPDEKEKTESGNIDGLVLSGGIDTHPRYYNGDTDYEGRPENGWNEPRDEYELFLLDEALRRSIPVLGICRGLQLINIYRGGNLFQHINEEGVAHQGGPDKKHRIHIQQNTLLAAIAGAPSDSFVNSAHHQSIRELGEGLAENCRSDDHIIEGIEWANKENKPFLLGVQWHPERMKLFGWGQSPLSKNIRDRFIHEIKKNTGR